MRRIGRWGAAIALAAMMAGCGTAPQGTALLKAGTASSVDAQSKQGLRAALKVYLTSLFHRLDQNGDGKLTQGEASAFFTAAQFSNLDVNGNGFVALSEILSNDTFMTLASAKLRDAAAASFQLLDANHDSKLTWEEYLAALNADTSVTTADKANLQLAFNLADKQHKGFLDADAYEDMISMADALAATTPITLQDAYAKASAQATAKFGAKIVPMGLTIRWMNRAGQFTRDEGAYVFTFWAPVDGQSGTYCEAYAKVDQMAAVTLSKDAKATHPATLGKLGLDMSAVLAPTKAMDAAVTAGLPIVGDRTSFFVQYIAASGGLPDRVYLDAFQVLSSGDKHLGGVTLEARTGKPMSGIEP